MVGRCFSELLSVCLLSALAQSVAVTVNTKYGNVRGQTHAIQSGESVNSFLAVPYAKPPTGQLRFAKPEEPEPWSETMEASVLGAACPQTSITLLLTHIWWDRYDEDCLHLNIYTPEDLSGGPYPVMVWFHGGAYSSSSNIQYPGYFAAAKGVVIVVPNYRLGALGFASTGDDVAPGNWGLWDQNMALKFVHENIVNFGGDPDQVTIFGQSAGASSTGFHIVSPESRGLFHRAIQESGSDITLWAVNRPESTPEDYTRQLAVMLECPTGGSGQMVDCLRTKDADTLIAAADNVTCTPGYFCLGFAPVIDGEGGFLPTSPTDIRRAGEHAKVDLMAGQTNKDGSFYTVAFIPESMDGGFNRTGFYDIIRNRLIANFAPILDNEKTVEDVNQAMFFQYTPWPHVDDTEEDDANRQAFNDMISDAGFAYAQDWINKFTEAENNVYYYILSYIPARASELIPEWIGLPHGGDLPFVWGWTLMPLNENLREETEMYVDLIDWVEKDAEYSDYVIELWTNFAKFGNPTPTPVAAPDGSMTTWPRYRAEDGLKYIDIDSQVQEKTNFRQDYLAFWQTYLPHVSGVDTFTAIGEMLGNMNRKPMSRIAEEILMDLLKGK